MAQDKRSDKRPSVPSADIRLRIVKGALVNPKLLDKFRPVLIETWDNPEWQGLLEVIVPLTAVAAIQKNMTKHYTDSIVPWYMDGELVDNPDTVICAFGADDMEGGKVFVFDIDDAGTYRKVQEYGVLNGIPMEQMDFLDANEKRTL